MMNDKKISKKKLHMIVGKRQIIIASLVLILGVAVYLNWQFSSGNKALTVADIFGTKQETSTSSASTYGQAELVNSTANNYFEQARLEKKQTQDEQSDTINTLLNSNNLSDEEKSKLSQQATNISKNKEEESSIENQVKAKGFEDCVAYVDSDRVNVTVKASDLTVEQAAQIKDIILGVTNIDPSGIVVTPVQ